MILMVCILRIGGARSESLQLVNVVRYCLREILSLCSFATSMYWFSVDNLEEQYLVLRGQGQVADLEQQKGTMCVRVCVCSCMRVWRMQNRVSCSLVYS